MLVCGVAALTSNIDWLQPLLINSVQCCVLVCFLKWKADKHDRRLQLKLLTDLQNRLKLER